ncbi:MAG: helix-turn-helix domain-containing protein [Lysobacterales bacterium]|jgi:transcriptional regulator with XRE-family HTH domain
MTMKGNAPTKESLRLKAAIDASDYTQSDIAANLEVDPTLVSQWCRSVRPVSIANAKALADMLGIEDPGQISKPWRDAQMIGVGQALPKLAPEEEDARRPELVIARLENDVHALSLALATIVSVMVVHRPAEAADAAEAMRKQIPRKWRDKGLLAEILQTLDLAPRR